jgi:hypothetical protein
VESKSEGLVLACWSEKNRNHRILFTRCIGNESLVLHLSGWDFAGETFVLCVWLRLCKLGESKFSSVLLVSGSMDAPKN